MVVDDQLAFISQRHVPQMALLNVRIDEQEGCLHLDVGNESDSVKVPLEPSEKDLEEYEIVRTKLWAHTLDCLALPRDHPSHALLSRLCGKPVRLVMQKEKRAAGQGADDGEHAGIQFNYQDDPAAQARLHDLYPFLIVSEESMRDVNERLGEGEDLDILRFRPSIVVRGLESAWSEDDWTQIKIGGNLIWIVALCKRCMVSRRRDVGVDFCSDPSAGSQH